MQKNMKKKDFHFEYWPKHLAIDILGDIGYVREVQSQAFSDRAVSKDFVFNCGNVEIQIV